MYKPLMLKLLQSKPERRFDLHCSRFLFICAIKLNICGEKLQNYPANIPAHFSDTTRFNETCNVQTSNEKMKDQPMHEKKYV